MTRPFRKTIDHLEQAGYPRHEAVLHVQARIDKYLDDNANALIGLIQQANENERARISQLITLATLLITVTGLFIAQQDIYKDLNSRHQAFILFTFVTLLVSIGLGVIEYFRNDALYSKWRKGHVGLHEAVNYGVDNGTFETIAQMQSEGLKHLEKLPASTGAWGPRFQLMAAMAGGLCFIVLLAAIMFDLPIIT